MRYLAQQAAKLVPFGGDFVAGAIVGAATWSIGEVALEYYDGNKQLNPQRLQELYKAFYQRFRRENHADRLLAEDTREVNRNDPLAVLDEPQKGLLEEGKA